MTGVDIESEAADGNEPGPALAVPEASTGEPLAACVRTALLLYLRNMDGHGVANLHRFVMEEVERPLLETVLGHAGGNQTATAKMLGISRSTLRNKLAKYDIG
jgi:Fis family transcriptional regulator